MRKILLITHRTLATGLRDALVFFTNLPDQIIAIPCYINENNEFPRKEVEKELSTTSSEDDIIIMTDLLSGSVNQNVSKYMGSHRFVITGINLALAMSILLDPADHLTSEHIEALIDKARQQMVLMNTYSNNDAICVNDE